MVRNISFALQRREVLGIAGLMGAGRSELARIIFGIDRHAEGDVLLGGQRIDRFNPRQLIARDAGFVTENRHAEGLLLEAPVAENLTLVTLRNHARAAGWLAVPKLRAAVDYARRLTGLDPKTRDSQPVRTLSGGNQQKVVLGKWLLQKPKLLILDEPTRGVDVGARYEIYRLLYQHADAGSGVLVISSEIEELIGICDRILVMRRGEIVDGLTRDQFSRERILASALGTVQEATT